MASTMLLRKLFGKPTAIRLDEACKRPWANLRSQLHDIYMSPTLPQLHTRAFLTIESIDYVMLLVSSLMTQRDAKRSVVETDYNTSKESNNISCPIMNRVDDSAYTAVRFPLLHPPLVRKQSTKGIHLFNVSHVCVCVFGIRWCLSNGFGYVDGFLINLAPERAFINISIGKTGKKHSTASIYPRSRDKFN